MKDCQKDEIPKHRKRSQKRSWKIVWEYIGPDTYEVINMKTGEKTRIKYSEDKVMKSFIAPWTQKYASERAANKLWNLGRMESQ